MGRRSLLKAGLAGIGTLASGCCGPLTETRYAWNNAVRTAGVDPRELKSPATLAELCSVVADADARGLHVRMTGSGHSFSDVAIDDDVLLVPGKLTRFLDLDKSQLRAPHASDPSLVRLESGARIRAVNDELWRRNLSLGVLGGWDAQTIVGAASTGTHGSGLGYGPITDSILSYQLVGSGGKVLQIEPSNGITDLARFPGKVDAPGGSVPADLVQDDETFHALSVGLGCLGVVYSVVVQTEPRFWLRESRKIVSWGDLKQSGGFLARLLAGQKLEDEGLADPVYYEIYVDPYPPIRGGSKESHRCILTRRYKLLTEPTGLSAEEQRRGPFGEQGEQFLTDATGKGRGLRDFVNTFPELVPDLLINPELDGVVDDAYVDRSYKVFNLGVVNEIRAYGIELALDMQQTIQATERLFETAEEFRKKNIMHATPPSLRFIRRTPAFLAMQEGRETMALEMGTLVGANDAEELFDTYERRYMEEFAARPHWGLDMNILQSFEQVRRLYPRTADRWLAVYKRLNARGTFNGRITDRLGISMPL